MRIIVMSDSHRRVQYLYDIIEKHMNEADMFIFLGDMDSDFDKALLLYPTIKYLRVVGNNDFSSPHPISDETVLNNKRIYLCHGHKHHVKFGYDEIIGYCKNIKADICLFGHTHIQYSDYRDGLYILNPGAVCIGEYAILDIMPNGIMTIPTKLK